MLCLLAASAHLRPREKAIGSSSGVVVVENNENGQIKFPNEPISHILASARVCFLQFFSIFIQVA